MFLNEERIILANPDILSENHLPPEIHIRETQLKEIAMCLRPITEGRKPMNCWFFGKPGVGKTSTARWTLRKLDSEAGIKRPKAGGKVGYPKKLRNQSII